MTAKRAESILNSGILIFIFTFLPADFGHSKAKERNDDFFTLGSGENLCELGGLETRRILTLVYGRGQTFGDLKKNRYCDLKNGRQSIQWVFMNLDSGEVISRSGNEEDIYFGASVSKLFVAAALLNKQNGKLRSAQLKRMVDMIVKSSNQAWIALQKQVGDDGSDDSGRLAVHRFTQHMGYTKTRGFQGWLTFKDGSRIHGNELNTAELSRFLYDTYHRKYQGAEILWKIMHATKTGSQKANKYTPRTICIGGKTGTYHGKNASPETVHLESIRAHNHVAVFRVNGVQYGLAILSNTGSDEDVAVLSGGLMREYLGIGESFSCENL